MTVTTSILGLVPMLIHHPQELAGKLAGAENLEPAAHHDH
jgi:hypothetical protein